jgi:hypothetical protein
LRLDLTAPGVMLAAEMDTAAFEDEVRLRKGESLNERLVIAGFGFVVCLFAIPDITSDKGIGIWSIIAPIVGCLLVSGAIFRRNIVWIITPDGILISEQHPFRQLCSRQIRRSELSEMRLQKDDANSTRFSLAFTTASGDVLISPPLPDVTRVHQTTARVARMFGFPDPEPANNPLDAINSEICLGRPVERKVGTGARVLIVLFGGMLSLPLSYALWNDQLSTLEAIAWSLGLVVATILFRYAHRMSGSFWMIRGDEIRVERLALNGAPEVQTIGRGDVESIGVEPGGSEDHFRVIAIRLRSGRRIRSPGVAGMDAAEALRAEILRRLNLPRHFGTTTR